jgi:hypothetical protein
MNIGEWANRLNQFEVEAHSILGRLESAKSRTITLDHSYNDLAGLSLKQDDIFRQALRCVENELYRAAHVMAWAGLVDCLLALIASDSFTRLSAARPAWGITSTEELAEAYTEFAIIDALQVMGALGKAEKKALHGMLSKRNECAHPGTYFPGFNETLGYISEVFSRLRNILNKYPGLVLK